MFKRVQNKVLNLQKCSRIQKSHTLTRTQVLIGSFALIGAGVLANSHFSPLHRFASAQSNIRTHIDGQIDLVGGNSDLVTVYLLYDSRVPT